MLQSIGTTEWIVIGAVVLLLFGGKKIPEFFKGLGDAVKEFRKASRDIVSSDDDKEKKS
jgi:sec-independent protein translocase protein TatA